MAASKFGPQFFVPDLALRDANTIGQCGLLIALGVDNLKRAWQYYHARVERELGKSHSILAGINGAAARVHADSQHYYSAEIAVLSEFPLTFLFECVRFVFRKPLRWWT